MKKENKIYSNLPQKATSSSGAQSKKIRSPNSNSNSNGNKNHSNSVSY